METIMEISSVQWYGIILLAFGLVLRYLVGRYNYYRRLRSWSKPQKYTVNLLVSIFSWLFLWVANCLMIGGVFLFLLEWYNKR
ncbi:hypothetical protein [Chitinophaga barathri]|uniref:Molybdenum ABC transporter permease n=1 Tax=Chitinophaga barathri TaxID=1647451 RepID=A0A3N4MV21_9BACT|nr:hypothetical protein [Chitinophaga barathri]RPD39313.1 hypothetical protein EG028_19495 [Chitinophaga barathri]